MSLVYSHPAVLFTPAVVRIVADPNLFTDDSDGGSLAEHHLSLAKLVQDLVTTTEFYSRSVFGCELQRVVYGLGYFGEGWKQ